MVRIKFYNLWKTLIRKDQEKLDSAYLSFKTAFKMAKYDKISTIKMFKAGKRHCNLIIDALTRTSEAIEKSSNLSLQQIRSQLFDFSVNQLKEIRDNLRVVHLLKCFDVIGNTTPYTVRLANTLKPIIENLDKINLETANSTKKISDEILHALKEIRQELLSSGENETLLISIKLRKVIDNLSLFNTPPETKHTDKIVVERQNLHVTPSR